MKFASIARAPRLRLLTIPSLVSLLVVPAFASGCDRVQAATISTATVCPPRAASQLRIHVINEAGAAPRTLEAAEREVELILAGTGLRLTWTFPPVAFNRDDRPTVVVIVRRALTPRISIDPADSHAASRPPLGWLVFQKNGQPGNLIEVSYEALVSTVMRGSHLEKPIGELPHLVRELLLGRGLGRVVAHELGHWLMGRGHTPDGLMRASFGVHDLLDPIAARMPRAVIAADPRCRPASPVVDPAVRDSDSAEPVTQMPNVGRSS